MARVCARVVIGRQCVSDKIDFTVVHIVIISRVKMSDEPDHKDGMVCGWR
jgi:hypothetical protein